MNSGHFKGSVAADKHLLTKNTPPEYRLIIIEGNRTVKTE